MLLRILLAPALAALALAQPAPPAAPTLVDPPIACDAVQYLDGADWTLSNAGGSVSVAGSVPGDVISDLQRAGVVGDPNYELNWLTDSPLWFGSVWTYSKTVSFSAAQVAAIEAGASDTLLVLDGVKMAATISLNGAQVGHATDQFLRYELSLSAAHRARTARLRAGDNTISVAFDPADQTTEGRFMACSGGWDWAGYIWNTTTAGQGADGPTPTRTLTSGLWKSVYLATVASASAAITHVVPHVFYLGAFPVAPLSDADNGGFSVAVRVHMWAPAGGATGTLSVSGAWPGAQATAPVSVGAGESNVTVTLAAPTGSVRLWWPAGTGGAQPLYEVRASFAPAAGAPVAAEPRRIGFRFVALTTGNDTDAAWRAANAGGDGNANQGMMIRVNGAALMIRGANMIPVDEFEGRYVADAFARIVKSSAEARMNLLRVWGGGVFAPAALRVLRTHASAHAPARVLPPLERPAPNPLFSPARFRFQLRRLRRQRHPRVPRHAVRAERALAARRLPGHGG